MATVTWVVFKHHKKADGTFNPKIRISHNRSSSYISTSIFTEFVKFKKGASSGTVTSEKLKEELDDIVKSYRNIINENQNIIVECETAKDVVSMIERRKKREEIDFISFARHDVLKIKNEGTRTIKTTGVNALCHFLKDKTENVLSVIEIPQRRTPQRKPKRLKYSDISVFCILEKQLKSEECRGRSTTKPLPVSD